MTIILTMVVYPSCNRDDGESSHLFEYLGPVSLFYKLGGLFAELLFICRAKDV